MWPKNDVPLSKEVILMSILRQKRHFYLVSNISLICEKKKNGSKEDNVGYTVIDR